MTWFDMKRYDRAIGCLVAACCTLTACIPTEPNQLDTLGTIRMQISGETFELWIADDVPEQQRGLMFIGFEQLEPLSDGAQRGMIFVFPGELRLSFWMKNTRVPLDIAYLDSDGVVVATHTMAPFEDRPGLYPSREPARFAIEVKAGTWDRLGLKPGDKIEIPPSLPNR